MPEKQSSIELRDHIREILKSREKNYPILQYIQHDLSRAGMEYSQSDIRLFISTMPDVIRVESPIPFQPDKFYLREGTNPENYEDVYQMLMASQKIKGERKEKAKADQKAYRALQKSRREEESNAPLPKAKHERSALFSMKTHIPQKTHIYLGGNATINTNADDAFLRRVKEIGWTEAMRSR